MAETSDQTLQGPIYYNGQGITLPSTMSFATMDESLADTEITKLQIGDLGESFSGSCEAFNEMLDYLVSKISAAGLQQLFFDSIVGGAASKIEPEILTVLASKCTDLKQFAVMRLNKATEEVKEALFAMTLDVI